MALRGRDEYTLDDRGRVAIPSRYRHKLGETVVLTPGQDGCVEVYSETSFEAMSDRLESSYPPTTRSGRRRGRLFRSQSQDTDLDRQGRILLPARFRVMLGSSGTVVIVGRRVCLEIWDPEKWDQEVQAALAEAESSSEQGSG